VKSNKDLVKSNICPHCFHEIGIGKSHTCNKTEKLKNIEKHLTPAMKEKIAATVIKEKVHQNGKTADIKLKTHGPPLNVSKLIPTPEPPQFSFKEIEHMKNDSNVSDTGMKRINKNLRIKLGRKIIQPHQRKSMHNKEKLVYSDIFDSREESFKSSDKKSIKRPLVICKEITEFTKRICDKRNQHPYDMQYKVGIDGDREFLKYTLTIYDDEETHVPTKRIKYSEGIGSRNRFKSTGVKKILILALAAKVPEGYYNCKKIIDLLQLNEQLSYKIAADLKLHNIIIGIQSHSSSFPCEYCLEPAGFHDVNSVYPLRTLNSIEKLALDWQRDCGKRSELKHYHNCEFPPAISGNEEGETEVLVKLPPPSLHLNMGAFNHIFDELKKAHPNLKIDWSDKLHVYQQPYHGDTFEGNDVRKLQRNLDVLDEILPQHFSAYVTALKALRDVNSSCLGLQLDEYYADVLKHFSESYRKLDISVTVKVHILEKHVKQYIERTNDSLGTVSEQVRKL